MPSSDCGLGAWWRDAPQPGPLRRLQPRVQIEAFEVPKSQPREKEQPVKVNSISGVSCIVKDLDKTAEFYQALGFRLGNREPDHVTCYVNWFWVTFLAQDKQEDQERKKEAKVS
jgi:hypothetical protein